MTRFSSVCLILLSAVILTPAGAQGQELESQRPTQSERWTEHLGAQFAQTLKTASEQHRIDALRLLIELKYQYGAEVDAQESVPSLLRIVEGEASETEKILAVTALHEIGDEEALQVLAHQMKGAPDSRVRQHTLRMLMARRSAQ
jgi:HEAT repeat protein